MLKLIVAYKFDMNKNGNFKLRVTDSIGNEFLSSTFNHDYTCIWAETYIKQSIGNIINESNFIRWSCNAIKQILGRIVTDMAKVGSIQFKSILRGQHEEIINISSPITESKVEINITSNTVKTTTINRTGRKNPNKPNKLTKNERMLIGNLPI